MYWIIHKGPLLEFCRLVPMFGVMLGMILEIFTVCMVVAHAYENDKTIEQCRQGSQKN
jgi:hypothetical protein